ncbi:MAG: hypothetical protein WBA97_34935 [Actinophytocola sp.]|uniref:hypothetical protein n=1 Tax=Actinophytocola sp. TaxID=1872138 RepID=UPI003C73F2D8
MSATEIRALLERQHQRAGGATREERRAAFIAEQRVAHPTLSDSYWEQQEERQRLQWQLDDLGSGVAHLIGQYGYHVERDPGDERLAALVEALRELSRSVFGSREGADR